MMPAALALERLEPLDRRPRHDGERDALPDIRYLAVPCRQQRRAHRTRPLALRTEHVAVDDEGILVAKQAGERDRAAFAFERVVLGDLAARRQCAALLGDAFDVAAQFDFLGQQRLAGAAVFGAL